MFWLCDKNLTRLIIDLLVDALRQNFGLVGDEYPDDATDMHCYNGEDEECAFLLNTQLKVDSLTHEVPQLCPQPTEQHFHPSSTK